MSSTTRTPHEAAPQSSGMAVDFDLVAGCESFRECPRCADWLVVWSRAGLNPQTICEHHRSDFVYLMCAVFGLDASEFRFVQI
ncbi:Uncharacterised protein [Mycobacteroides abscessus subsp. massiliense]|nr:Uncharacterised protein [Mycobacteroides abscessus subsp. abscessus]SKQ84004.1 Uncharacterised protein [Mycobacteroides abscessus subsp. massiliense]SLC49631.1 Uncharacterised protein [Mycobacteroides abscessus subsp. massiliense]